ncbi:MAG TPA: LysM peptidoglycan-binding domain-containing protein [Solirubrobacteraceae bacterium]|nr:LysM peptidoglycan-binding domain-containing protein [Solirubrobacteraceae bacterium]
MRLRLFLLISVAAGALLALPAVASAYFVHVVAPGETLSSIASQDGLTVDQLAAANGISPSSELVAGSTVQIPPQGSSATAAPDANTGWTTTAAPASPSEDGSYVVQPGDTLSAIAARAGVTVDQLAALNGLNPNAYLISGTALQLPGGSGTVQASDDIGSSVSSAPGGSYVVQPGDTLSAIAARAGVTVDQLAALNGLNPNAYLISGTAIQLPSSSGTEYVSAATSSSAASSQPIGATAEGQPTDPPYPTPQTVTAPEVGSIAAADGVPSSLADAIAWQESGFNNDLVSSADARGVMQILPGTWQWIQSDLNQGPPLAPASATDNVRGGVLMLRSLLDATGGDSALAAAGYYQGLSSVQQNGMYADTQQYVHDVMSLEQQFAGAG